MASQYTAYNLFSFFVLSRVATSTHAVLNVFRRVVVRPYDVLSLGALQPQLNP